jgi:hypothetical protein
MKTLRLAYRVLLILAAGSALAIQSQNSNKPNSVLDRHSEKTPLKNAPISDVVVDALRQQNVPGGVAVSYYCSGYENHSLRPTDDTLRSRIDAAVAAEPENTWSVDDGVVNMVPRYRELLFLKTIVPNLEIKEAVTTAEALDKLLAVPEVSKQATLELGIHTFGGGIYQALDLANPRNHKISLSLTNVTVLEALNAIARARGDGIWLLVDQQCPTPTGRKFYSLRFMDL